ncbi:MAG: RNA polymerase sigma factor [Pseudomonadota bacterium]
MTELEDPDPDQAIRRALVGQLPKLRRFCLALTASPADADDLCQATCERAITRLDRWVPGTRLDSWLYRMAQNLHKNAMRDRTNRLRILEEQAPLLAPAADEPAASAGGIDAIQMRRHMMALPQEQREVLTLICVEGHSYKECADLLDLTPATVTNRLFEARVSLRRAMETDVAPDGANNPPKRRAST